MENISHSLQKRSFISNSNGGFTSHKSVYDDVFGGPPKFGLPTLSPRLEDYAEIFGGFHTSRSSSIPVIDIPVIGDDSALYFDSRSPGFNYAEVFGDYRGLDWTTSFEDIAGQSSGGYDSSDEAWSPAQSGSFSDELDPLSRSDKSHKLSDDDSHQSLESNKEFNVAYNKSSQRIMETVLAGTSYVTKYDAVPGYTCSRDETPVSLNAEDDYCTIHVADDINCSQDFGERVPEEKQYNKCSSNPLGSGISTHGNDFNPSDKHGNSTYPLDRPFMSVSDISLRTKPSRLPPPSRPPPSLTVNKGECDRTNPKLKASKSYAFERVANDGTPLFFDVEIDANLSFEGTNHGNKNVNMKRDRTKESIEGKDFRSHTNCHSANVTNVEGKIHKVIDLSRSFQGDKRLESHGKDTTGSALSTDDRIGSRMNLEEFPDSRGGQHSDQIADISAGPVAWTEAADYFEVIEKNISREPFKTVDDSEAYTPKEENKKFKVTKEAPRWDEKRNQHEMTGDDFDWGNKRRTKSTNTRWLSDQKEFQEKVMLNKLACAHNSNRMMPDNFMQSGKSGKPQIGNGGSVDEQVEAKCNVNEVEEKVKLNSFCKMEIEENRKGKENSGKHEENIVKEKCQGRLESLGRAEIRARVNESTEHEGLKEQQNGACGNINENMMKGSHVLKRTEIIKVNELGESGNKSYMAVGKEKKWDLPLPLEVNKDKEKESLMEAVEQKFNDLTFGRAFELAGDDKEQKLASKWEVVKESYGDASVREDSELRVRKAETELGNKGEICETKAYKHLGRDADRQELSGETAETDAIERNMHDREVSWDLKSNVPKIEDQMEVLDGACKIDGGTASKVAGKHDNTQILERTQAAFSCDGIRELKNQSSGSPNESEARMDDPLVKSKFNKLQDGNTQTVRNNIAEYPSLPKQSTDSFRGGVAMGSIRVMPEKTPPSMVYIHENEKIISYKDDRDQSVKGTEVIIEEVDIKDSVTPCQIIRESVVNGRKMEKASSVLEHNEDSLISRKISRNQNIERKDKNMKEDLVAKDHKVGVRIRREIELENEHLRKIEEEREREREREKDRMAVDKAALEACERSYVEAREKAERAAAERATSEVRQRGMAESRERLDKASMEVRLRTERAAVERATIEARQRAAEKLMAEKSAFDARERVEKSVPDRFSASSRFADTKQSYLSSDLHFQNTGISHGLRQSYFSAHAGSEGESPQRCKARLERYRRTAERSAKALAEKNRRDLLAQKEREERNRVAEALDAEVKRWSSGKEGNLRALLSTLQYILGPHSGWQPVPLTEVITSSAVKKAYRKATLCVHPDKLQQRGATIQQKYICEKVFDLLKEAWNKFNSEER